MIVLPPLPSQTQLLAMLIDIIPDLQSVPCSNHHILCFRCLSHYCCQKECLRNCIGFQDSAELNAYRTYYKHRGTLKQEIIKDKYFKQRTPKKCYNFISLGKLINITDAFIYSVVTDTELTKDLEGSCCHQQCYTRSQVYGDNSLVF